MLGSFSPKVSTLGKRCRFWSVKFFDASRGPSPHCWRGQPVIFVVSMADSAAKELDTATARLAPDGTYWGRLRNDGRSQQSLNFPRLMPSSVQTAKRPATIDRSRRSRLRCHPILGGPPHRLSIISTSSVRWPASPRRVLFGESAVDPWRRCFDLATRQCGHFAGALHRSGAWSGVGSKKRCYLRVPARPAQ